MRKGKNKTRVSRVLRQNLPRAIRKSSVEGELVYIFLLVFTFMIVCYCYTAPLIYFVRNFANKNLQITILETPHGPQFWSFNGTDGVFAGTRYTACIGRTLL